VVKNNPRVGRSINDTVTMLNAGESAVAGSGRPQRCLRACAGQPACYGLSTDGSVLIIAPSSIMKGCKHPNAARLFMEFLMSRGPLRSWWIISLIASDGNPTFQDRQGGQRSEDHPANGRRITKGVPEVIKQWRENVRRVGHDKVTIVDRQIPR